MADVSAIALTKGIDLLHKIVEKNGGKLLGVAADSATKLKEALAVNFSAYFEDAVDRCSRVAILFDRSKSARLSSLYVRSYLEYAQITVPDTKFRNLIATLPARDSRRTFLVIASAGSGKTFLMKWLFLNILENESSRIPFYIELRGVNYKPNTDLLRFLYDTIVARRARISFESFQSGMNGEPSEGGECNGNRRSQTGDLTDTTMRSVASA